MLSFRRVSFLVALGLACCLVLCVQSQEMTTLERRRTITRRIKGHEYTLKKLSSSVQGQNSETYKVVGGFEGVAAIVKIIDPGQSRTISDRAAHEAAILRKDTVNQLLHVEKVKKHSHVYEWTFVLQDIHANYPDPGDRLAPLHEFIEANPEAYPDIATAVRQVRALAIRRAEELARNSNFVYRDIQPLNVFTNRELTEVHFIDYGFPGVVDVSSGFLGTSSRSALIAAAAALRQMRENAQENFTVEAVRRYMRSRRHGSHGSHGSHHSHRRANA
ncbi:hypothetical protein CPB85DRAFT_1431475 [Mucidula mucida]|nr:hypothetical protein CPB85DRAFT_1431475 [Mucidula mucida]